MHRFFLLLVLAGSLVPLTRAVYAQTAPSGSISGRIVVEGQASPHDSFSFLIVPASTSQPLTRSQAYQFAENTNTDGTFSNPGLADGGYLLAFGIEGAEYVTPLPETVTVQSDNGTTALPAMRVTIAGGSAVTGLEIVIRLAPVPTIVDPPLPTATAIVVAFPNTGTFRDSSPGDSIIDMTSVVVLVGLGLLSLSLAGVAAAWKLTKG